MNDMKQPIGLYELSLYKKAFMPIEMFDFLVLGYPIYPVVFQVPAVIHFYLDSHGFIVEFIEFD